MGDQGAHSVNKMLALFELCRAIGVKCGPARLTPSGAVGPRHVADMPAGAIGTRHVAEEVEVEVVPLYSWWVYIPPPAAS
jgi:hypothetical protein